MNIPVSLLLQSVSNRIHAAAGVILYPSALLVAYWTVLRCTTWAATNTFFDELIYWPGPLRRRVVRRKFFTRLRDATAVILMVASCSMIFYNSLAPPLSVTHPILSDKWGPSSRAFGALPPACQRRQQAPSREATDPQVTDRVNAVIAATARLSSLSAKDVLSVSVHTSTEQWLQQRHSKHTAAAAAAAVSDSDMPPALLHHKGAAATPHDAALSTAMSANAKAGADQCPTTEWALPADGASLQQCQFDFGSATVSGGASTVATMSKAMTAPAPAVDIASDGTTVAVMTAASRALAVLPSASAMSASLTTSASLFAKTSSILEATSTDKQLKAFIQLPDSSHLPGKYSRVSEETVPVSRDRDNTITSETDSVSTTDISEVADAAASREPSYSPKNSMVGHDNIHRLAAPVSADMITSTPQAALPASFPTAESDDRPYLQPFSETLLGKVLVRLFMFALGAIIIPGTCLQLSTVVAYYFILSHFTCHSMTACGVCFVSLVRLVCIWARNVL